MKKVLYINAGAGSGKTYRLTHDLPGHIIKDKISPSEIIVTTFTVAAAEEIRERARKVLLDNKQTDLAAQLDTAAIGTIHSICQLFIQKYWYAIGMAPESDVLSEADKQMYRNQSIAAMLQNNAFANERAAIDRYYQEFRPKHKVNEISTDYPEFWTEMLDQMVGKLAYYDIKSSDIPDCNKKSKEEVKAIFNKAISITINDLVSIQDEAIKALEKGINDKIAEANAKGKEPRVTTLQGSLKSLKRLRINDVSYHYVLSLYSNIHNKDGKPILEELESSLEKLNDYLCSKQYSKAVEDLIDSLFTLAQAWQQEYDRFKKSHCVIDYDDMERGMLALLENKTIREEIGRNYKLVMVDEFQDCNPIQLRIFNLLSEAVADNSPLAQSSIWVGDPEQAIYSFRGSNTDLINYIAGFFPKKKNVAGSNGLMRDELDKSYRSREPLVTLANVAFSNIFPNMVKLKPYIPERPKYIDAIHHLQIKEKGNSNQDYYLNLARHIKAMVESQKYHILPKGEEKTRPLRYGDIALLVRANTAASQIAYEMMCAEVPVFVPESNIWDRAEVQLVMSLLRLTENRSPEVRTHEIASLMRLWNNDFTNDIIADKIAFIAQNGKDDTTWQSNSTKLAPLFLAIDAVKDKPFDEKVSELILLLSLNDIVAKWGEADVRRANLCTLEKAVSSYCQRCDRLGIDKDSVGFGIYLQESKIDVAKVNVPNAVKIVTYHGSKGLEWPMVMLLELDKHYTGDNDVKKSFFGVREQMTDLQPNGFIPSYRLIVNPNFLNDTFPECIKGRIKSISRYDDTSKAAKGDAARLMYVGMTRAREYLFTVDKGDKFEGIKWFTAIDLGSTKDDVWGCGISVKVEFVEPILEPYPEKPKLSKSKKPEKIAENNASLAQWEKDKKDVDKRNSKEANRHHIPLGKYQVPDVAPLSDDGFTVRDIHPSKLECTKSGFKLQYYELEGVHFFPKKVKETEYAALGTCIHNAFAAYNPTASQVQTLAMFRTVIANHDFANSLKSEHLYTSISELYNWLTEKYGAGTALHEVPFRHIRNDGTNVIGEMDLIWKTAKDMVLVDFKNFISADVKTALDPSNEKHYAGKYVPQLAAYHDALMASGETVLASLIYYSTMGMIVEIKKV